MCPLSMTSPTRRQHQDWKRNGIRGDLPARYQYARNSLLRVLQIWLWGHAQIRTHLFIALRELCL